MDNAAKMEALTAADIASVARRLDVSPDAVLAWLDATVPADGTAYTRVRRYYAVRSFDYRCAR